MGVCSSSPRTWASMARPLWAADVAESAEDTEPRQNRSPHRSEESIFNRPNKLVGMYPLNRLSLRNRCARLARLPNSNGIFLRKINVVPSHTVLGVNADELLTRFRRWGLDPPWTCCLDRRLRVDPPPAWFPCRCRCRRTRIDPPGYWPAILSVLKWPATPSVRVIVVGIVLGSSQQVM